MKIRILPRVPSHGVNVGFVQSPAYESGTHLAFLSTAREEEGNVIVLSDRLISGTGGVVPVQDILVSTRSVLRSDNSTPIPLFFTYEIGRGRYVVQLPGIASNQAEAAQQALRNHLRFVRDDGSLADVNWDLDLPVWSDPGWVVTIYLDRRNTETQTIWVQYDGYDLTSSTPARNRREVVNSEPLTTGVSVAVANTGIGTGVMQYEVNAGSSDDYAPALGFFNINSYSPNVVVTATGVAVVGSTRTDTAIGSDIPIRDVVSDINRRSEEVKVVTLNDSYQSDLVTGTYATTGTTLGTVVRYNNIVRVRIDDTTRIQAEKPWPGESSTPWFPRLKNGIVVQDYTATFNSATAAAGTRGSGSALFNINEFNKQAWSFDYGVPYKSITNERPFLVTPTVAKTRRFPLKSTDDITLFFRGRQRDSLIRDVDLETGRIYLTRRIERREDLSLDYIYEEKWYEYRDLNLNALPNQNQDFLSKYVGVFVLPDTLKIDTTDYTLTTELFGDRTVYHTFGKTYQQVLDRINNYTVYRLNESIPGTDNQVLANPFILGVYRIVQNRSSDEAVSIVDARTQGGGIDKIDADVDIVEVPEVRMFSDIGYWDGEAFPTNNVLIADTPDIGRISLTGYPSTFDPTTGTVEWADPTGRLTDEEILDTLHRYAAAGSLVLREVDLAYPTGV